MTDTTSSCPDDSTLLELALGELTGRDRADSLAHVARCATCRGALQVLVEVAEQVLLAAPEAEPPAGFESTVLHRLGADPVRSRRRVGIALVATAAVVLVVLATAIGIGVTRGADQDMTEAAMLTTRGRDVGRVWRYDSRPTWLLVSVPRWRAWERGGANEYRLRARLDDGRTVDIGPVSLAADGAWGTTTRHRATSIHAVAIVDATGRVWCEGTF